MLADHPQTHHDLTLSPWRWRVIAILHYYFLSINSCIDFCNAQILSAYEQLYGPWNIKLTKNIFGRRRWHLEMIDCGNNAGGDPEDKRGKPRKRDKSKKEASGDLQLLFPRAQRILLDGENETQKILSTQHELDQFTTKSVRSASCVLNLERSGKFTLSLLEDPLQTTILSSSPIHQPLNGEWYLTPNPYCVTDRHYDTLLLVSEPRMRRLCSSAKIERATVELRCKIWGRYGAGAVRKKKGFKHGRVRGRMTHGTIMIVKEEVDGVGATKKLPTKEIACTFCGKANMGLDSSGAKKIDGEEDLPFNDGDVEDNDLNFDDNFDAFGVLRPIKDE